MNAPHLLSKPPRPPSQGGAAPRIVFAMLTAVTPAATIEQLARRLAPHRLVIHHSPHMMPAPRIQAANVDFVPNPDAVTVDSWSMTSGLMRLIAHCVENVEFDYLQLITPNCLPVRPLSEFVDFVATDPNDAHIEHIDLANDELAWMTYAYRLYAPANSWRFRLLWKMHCWYVPASARRETRGGLEIPLECAHHADGKTGRRARIARTVTWAARGGLLGEHPFGTAFKPWVGSVWFGARRPVCHYLLRRFSEPGVKRWFSGMSQAEEVMFATLLGNSSYRLGHGNHYIAGYEGARTRTLGIHDLPKAIASGRFFARKFSDAIDAPERVALLRALATAAKTGA